MSRYLRPATLDEALAATGKGVWTVLAGGTDIYPTAGTRLAGDVLDLTGIAALRGISDAGGGLRIGACTTWTEIAGADLPPACRALQQAAGMVGGRQIQNSGTIGGNLCTASPAADGVPALLVLEARVELASTRGVRQMPLAEFLTGPRRTAKAADEVLAAILLSDAGLEGVSAFEKLGARAYLVISIAMVAARLVADGGRVAGVALAVGACSGVAQRLVTVERALVGQPLAGLGARVGVIDVAAALSPIDDIRATAAYRAKAAAVLVARALDRAVGALA